MIQILEEYRVSVKESNGTKAMQRLATLHMLLHHVGKYKALESEQQFIALEEIKNFHNITLEGLFICYYSRLKRFIYSSTLQGYNHRVLTSFVNCFSLCTSFCISFIRSVILRSILIVKFTNIHQEILAVLT